MPRRKADLRLVKLIIWLGRNASIVPPCTCEFKGGTHASGTCAKMVWLQVLAAVEALDVEPPEELYQILDSLKANPLSTKEPGDEKDWKGRGMDPAVKQGILKQIRILDDERKFRHSQGEATGTLKAEARGLQRALNMLTFYADKGQNFG